MKAFLRTRLMPLLCALAAMAAAILVRLPAARLAGVPAAQRASYISESGLPYFTDPDSYYHVRLAENYLRFGALGDTVNAQGVPWDSHSYAPEGRTAEYQPGIILLAVGAWRVLAPLGIELAAVEFWLAAVMAALGALTAFLLGRRMAGTAGGLAAGIFVSCASAFVMRTVPGRFDTDMFAAVMNVAELLLFTEALRARTARGRIAAAAGFAAVVTLYCQCWSVFAFLLAVVTLLGGLMYLILLFFAPGGDDDRGRLSRFLHRPEPRAFFLCAALTVLLVLIVNGPAFFSQFFGAAASVNSFRDSAALPNLYGSVSELRTPRFLPGRAAEALAAYTPGQPLTVVNGVGGGTVFLLCLAAAAALLVRAAIPGAEKLIALPRRYSALYLCVLLLWLAGGLYVIRQGSRFIEYLSIPVGLLAGAGVGFLAPTPGAGRPAVRAGRIAAAAALTAAAVTIPLFGAYSVSHATRPATSDASAGAMAYIRERVEAPDGVIASWWDNGYFYESGSGRPALWDGGSQDGLRAILLSRALTAEDPVLSRNILGMLAAAGNGPAEYLAERLGVKKACAVLFDALTLTEEAARAQLFTARGLSPDEAAHAAAMLEPAPGREVWLVITDDMLYKLGLIEYYADWDFTGETPLPDHYQYNLTPEGSTALGAEDPGVLSFFEARARETIWRLFFDHDGSGCFTLVFEDSDAVSRVQVWRAEP